MNEPSSKDLLGYMLGALEADEHQQIEELLEQDNELKEEFQNVRSQVALLDGLDPPGTPPVGLARRACEHIAAQPAAWLESVQPNAPAPKKKLVANSAHRRWFSDTSEGPRGQRRNSLMDFVIVVVVLMLLAAIALPVINNNRFNSRVLACQDNLRTVGMGLLEYSDNSGGKFIQMPESGNLAFAGVYAPQLMDGGYVEDSSSFMCAGVGNAQGRYIPTIKELEDAGNMIYSYQKTAGGDFAYTMGIMKDGRHEIGFNQHRSDYILLADNPSVSLPGRASDNHGGYGQNVFFEDGRIAFLSSPEVDGDAIYENDLGCIAPGISANDIVLVRSATTLHNFRVD